MSDLDEPDIDALHRAVLREQKEPIEGREPVPIWMRAVFVVLIAWGGWYLGRYDAGFDAQRADMQPLATEAQSSSPSEPATAGGDAAMIARGAELFGGRCAACHQATGKGLPGVAPPLDGSEWVTGDPARTTRVILHGLTGPIEVAGQPWNGAMPAWGATMTDAEVAAVISYIRTTWSNEAGVVSPEEVKHVRDAHADRSSPWTAQEL